MAKQEERQQGGPLAVVAEVTDFGVLETQTRAEVDLQITTAHRYPRSIGRARQRVLELATASAEIAEDCFYTVPRAGELITGESVRLAEIVASAYGNLRFGARVTAVDVEHVTAQGACHDLETNIAVSVEVKRRIVDKYGRRYSPDMIAVTANAACSIALRNALFKVVPKALFAEEFAEIKKVSAGDEKTMKARLTALVDWFAKREPPVKAAALCTAVAKKTLDDLTLEDLATLRDVANAIKSGEISVAEAFPAEKASEAKAGAKKTRTRQLEEQLARKAEGDAKAQAEVQAAEPQESAPFEAQQPAETPASTPSPEPPAAPPADIVRMLPLEEWVLTRGAKYMQVGVVETANATYEVLVSQVDQKLECRCPAGQKGRCEHLQVVEKALKEEE